MEQDKKALAGALVKGLEYLKNTDFSKLPEGRYEIDRKNLLAIVQDYQTTPKAESEAESHREYIDIQFLANGSEVIGWGLTGAGSEVLHDLGAKQDTIIYKTIRNEIDLVLHPGMYAIFFPTDIHRPCCNFGAGGRVKKVVLKVAVELLD